MLENVFEGVFEREPEVEIINWFKGYEVLSERGFKYWIPIKIKASTKEKAEALFERIEEGFTRKMGIRGGGSPKYEIQSTRMIPEKGSLEEVIQEHKEQKESGLEEEDIYDFEIAFEDIRPREQARPNRIGEMYEWTCQAALLFNRSKDFVEEDVPRSIRVEIDDEIFEGTEAA